MTYGNGVGVLVCTVPFLQRSRKTSMVSFNEEPEVYAMSLMANNGERRKAPLFYHYKIRNPNNNYDVCNGAKQNLEHR